MAHTGLRLRPQSPECLELQSIRHGWHVNFNTVVIFSMSYCPINGEEFLATLPLLQKSRWAIVD